MGAAGSYEMSVSNFFNILLLAMAYVHFFS
jgi:hypothetical protein